jgi:prepilin-type N-terminal cleavage/methylation domain-containing protein
VFRARDALGPPIAHTPVVVLVASARSRDRHAVGFTLLEVIVALALLSGSLLAVAHVMTLAARAGDRSRETTIGTALAAQKMEQLRATAYGLAADGSEVTDRDSDLAGWPDATAGGSGLSWSPPAALAENTAGFVDYLDVRGRWIGEGASPPPGTVFARRWSIDPDAASPGGTVLRLRVGVWRRGPPGPWAASDPRAWVPVAILDGARTRRRT